MHPGIRTFRVLLVCLIGVPGSGCNDSGSTPGLMIRDSVGIRIVENGPVPSGAAQQLQLSDEPLFRIGWREDGHHFSRISGGALLPDGRSVIVDQMENRAVIVSPEGEVLGSIGAAGDGPGEFRAMRRVATLGSDSLAIQDGYRGFSIFHQGEFVRSIPILDFQLTMLGSDGGQRVFFGPPTMLEPYPDGSPDRWTPLEIPVVDVDGDAAQPFVVIEHALRTSGNIFAPQTVVGVAGGRLVTARQDRPEVRWLDPEGRVSQIARWAATPASPGDSLWNVVAEGFHAQWDGVMGEEEIRASIARDRDRSSGPIPLFGRMVGSSRGSIWLAEYTPYWGDPPRRYYVISSEGEWLGTVVMPERFELLDVRDDRILGVQKGPFDVEAAVAFEVTRPPS